MPGRNVRSLVGYLSVLAFVALLGVSGFLYPGGTWTDSTTTSYRFFENFFCDLTHETGLNGMPNTGAIYAKAALIGVAPALWLFYSALAERIPTAHAGWQRAVRGFGILSALGLLFVPITPSDRFALLHTAAALSASVAGLLGLLAFAISARRSSKDVLPALCLLLMVTVDVVLYVQQVRTHGPTPVLLPALQKVAALWLVGWMLVLFRPRPSNPTPAA